MAAASPQGNSQGRGRGSQPAQESNAVATGSKASNNAFADVDVKHSSPLAERPLVDEVDDTLHRGMADALIVSGAGTGKPTDPSKVQPTSP